MRRLFAPSSLRLSPSLLLRTARARRSALLRLSPSSSPPTTARATAARRIEARSTIASIAWSVSPAPLGRKPIAPFCSPKRLRLRRRAARRLGAAETTALLRAPLPIGPGGLGRRLRSRELEPSRLDDQASSSSVPRALIHFRSVTTLFQGRRGAMPCMDENFERPP